MPEIADERIGGAGDRLADAAAVGADASIIAATAAALGTDASFVGKVLDGEIRRAAAGGT